MADKKPAKIKKTEDKPAVIRDKSGKFVKGQSGNPSGKGGGRPKMPEELKEAFRELTPAAVQALSEIINSSASKPMERIKAAEVILDRGWGKPTQSMEIETNKIPQVVFINGDDVLD